MMQCPRCELSLALNEAEWHIGYTCEKCAGIWLPSNYLESLKHAHQFDVGGFRRALSNNKVESKKKHICPTCNTTLNRSKVGGVELDWCEKCHGVWFDRRELTEVATFKAEGAQSAAMASDGEAGFVALLITRMLDSYFEKHPEQMSANQAEADGYVPNHIPAKERAGNLIFSVLLFLYGTYGVYVNDLYIPGKRSKGVHLHDLAAWAMYGAIICACLVMISVIVDHYDKRNNERRYREFANTAKFFGWGCFVVSLVLMIAGK